MPNGFPMAPQPGMGGAPAMQGPPAPTPGAPGMVGAPPVGLRTPTGMNIAPPIGANMLPFLAGAGMPQMLAALTKLIKALQTVGTRQDKPQRIDLAAAGVGASDALAAQRMPPTMAASQRMSPDPIGQMVARQIMAAMRGGGQGMGGPGGT